MRLRQDSHRYICGEDLRIALVLSAYAHLHIDLRPASPSLQFLLHSNLYQTSFSILNLI